MYASLLEARLLEERLVSREHRRREPALLTSMRAAAVACCKPGDLVSDASPSAAADLMLGTPLRDAVRGNVVPAKDGPVPVGAQRLPVVQDLRRQLGAAIGAAQALKAQRGGGVMWVFSAARRDPALWREVLGDAGRQDLPIVFLLWSGQVSGARGMMPLGGISDRARQWGVPGIPADAADGVALYRVLSEASLRARSGDGPTLVEGVIWRLEGKRTQSPADPLLALSLSLLARGAATTRWQAGVARRFRTKLQALERTMASKRRRGRGLH